MFMRAPRFWDLTRRGIAFPYGVNSLRCVISHKRADLIYMAVEA